MTRMAQNASSVAKQSLLALILASAVLRRGSPACAEDNSLQLFRKGLGLFLAKDYDAACTLFEEGLRVGQNAEANGRAAYYSGQCAIRANQEQAAYEAFKKSYALSPKSEQGIAAFLEMRRIERARVAAAAEARRAEEAAIRRRQSAEAAARDEQRAREQAEARAIISRRGLILDNLSEAEKYYIVVKRDLTPTEAQEPGRKEETAYCVWFEEKGFYDDPAKGTTLNELKLFARAANDGQRTVSWRASASWNEDQSTLRIRPTDSTRRLGIDITRSNGRVVPRPANWPFPIVYALRRMTEPCFGTVRAR